MLIPAFERRCRYTSLSTLFCGLGLGFSTMVQMSVFELPMDALQNISLNLLYLARVVNNSVGKNASRPVFCDTSRMATFNHVLWVRVGF